MAEISENIEVCTTYKIKKENNDVNLSIHIEKTTPKELVVEAITLPCGSSATATLIDDEKLSTLLFGIPRGCNGDDGENGQDGIDGKDGLQGVPGEKGDAPRIVSQGINKDGSITLTWDITG